MTDQTPDPLHVTMDLLQRPDDLTDAENREWSGSDMLGHGYAWGRMDQGHPPVVVMPEHGTSPSQTATAWHFGVVWAALQREYRHPDGRGGYFPGIQAAWDTYAATGGRSLRRS